MNKILIKLYVPILGEKYELWIPLGKQLYNIIKLLTKAVSEMNGGYDIPEKLPTLYNKATGKPYSINLNIKETNIRNGTELILI